MKYKVNYSGYAYVEANSPEEAEEEFFDGCDIYDEKCIDSVEEIDEFVVMC